MDRIEAMSTLLAVVHAGSISAALRELRTPIATVSRRIAELEAHLTRRLLSRTTRCLALTDAGEVYAAACRHILEQVEEAEGVAFGEYRAPRGELTATATMMLGRRRLIPIATDLLGAYPDIVLHLCLGGRALELHQEYVDVAVRLDPLLDSSLVAHRVGEVSRVITASLEYLARRGTPKTPAGLAARDCLDFAGFRRFSAWDLGSGDTAAVRPRLSIDAGEPRVDAAVADAGIVDLLSIQIAIAVRTRALMLLLRGFEPGPLPVHLVYLGGGPLLLKGRAFLDFAAPRLKAALEANPPSQAAQLGRRRIRGCLLETVIPWLRSL